MSKHGKEDLRGCLTGGEGMKLENIKFFRGSREGEISHADFEAEVRGAAERKKSGKVVAGNIPAWKDKTVDVREVVVKN
jgi:hypothetical protein